MSDAVSRFELVTAELRRLGVTLLRLPGEYCVNYRNGSDSTARMADDLDEALELGRAMAVNKAAEKAPLRRKWRPRRMTAKAQRRRFIRRHNRRVRVRAMRKRHGKR